MHAINFPHELLLLLLIFRAEPNGATSPGSLVHKSYALSLPACCRLVPANLDWELGGGNRAVAYLIFPLACTSGSFARCTHSYRRLTSDVTNLNLCKLPTVWLTHMLHAPCSFTLHTAMCSCYYPASGRHSHPHSHAQPLPNADAFADGGDFATVVKIAAKFKFDMRQAESLLDSELESKPRLASVLLMFPFLYIPSYQITKIGYNERALI